MRGNEEIKLKFGDLVKMHGVHAKRSDRTYVNCRLVEVSRAPDWDLSTPDTENHHHAQGRSRAAGPERGEKDQGQQALLPPDIGEHKIML